jgi:phage gp46-like protein
MDIAIVWDAVNNRGDWTVADGDLATGDDLESMVLICLFTDKALPAGTVPPDGTDDPRGWCGDSYAALPIGSLLWTLRRRSISNASALLREARDICNDALAVLVTDGVAESVNVQTYYPSPGQLGFIITIAKPAGISATFKYQWAWGAIN